MTNQLINHQPVHSRKDIQRIKYLFCSFMFLINPSSRGTSFICSSLNLVIKRIVLPWPGKSSSSCVLYFEFYWIIRYRLSLSVLDVSIYLYKCQQIWEQSVRNLGFTKQLDFIALYLDAFTSVKSRDMNNKLYQHSIRKVCGFEPKDIIFQ